MRLIIGNILALIASLLFVYSGIIKRKDKILFAQCLQKALSTVSNVVLQGYSGAVVHAISFIRNLLCYFGKLSLVVKIVLSIITIVLSILFNNLGVIGLLPLLSSLLYLWFMDIKDIIKFKYLMIITIILWGTYDFFIQSYTSFGFGIISFIATYISIFQIKKQKKVSK